MASIDTDRFLELFVGAQSQVYGYIAMFLTNRADVEDLFQQTSLVLWKKRDQYDTSRKFISWALGIAHNEVRNFIRRKNRGGVLLSEAVIERLAAVRHKAADRIETQLQRLADCMDGLTADQRELIEECYLGDKSIKAVAEQRQVDPAVFYKRLDRIRWSLLDCIESGGKREERA